MPPRSVAFRTKYYFDVDKTEILVSIYLHTARVMYIGVPEHYEEILMSDIKTPSLDVYKGPIDNPYILTIKMQDGTIHRIDVSIPKVEF